MTERFSEIQENARKHSGEHNLAQGLFSDGNFWLDTAKGLLPKASESLQEGVRTGQVWGALGEGAALGIGLSWMTNQLRPSPVRIIGGLINTGILGKFAWDSGQTVGQLLDLKKHAYESGNYKNNVSQAQKLTGKFVADNAVGILGAHIGFVGEHGIHHAMSTWKGKPQLASTVPVGLENSGRPLGNPHDIAESPFYLAMSKARRNKKAQNKKANYGSEAKAESPVESTKPEPENAIELKPQDVQVGKDNQNSWASDIFYGKEVPKSEALTLETFKLLDEKALGKGKPTDADTFEDLASVKKALYIDTFRTQKGDLVASVEKKLTNNEPSVVDARFRSEVDALRQSKNDEELAEILLQNADTAVDSKAIEAKVDNVLSANERFADEILAVSEKSSLVKDLFLDVRSGKYPEDAHVVFIDANGRLITYKNDYVADRTFHYPVKHVAKGLADFELMSSDIVKGAVIFGPAQTGNRPLLGMVGDIPVRLLDCGNYKDFLLTSRLDKKLSQFDFKTGIRVELAKSVPEPAVDAAAAPSCKDGVCSIDQTFLEKIRAKSGALSAKPVGMELGSKEPRALDPIQSHPVKVDHPELSSPQSMPKTADVVESPIAVGEPESAVQLLLKEQKSLMDKNATHEQAKEDGIQDGVLNKKSRKEIKKRLKQIENELAAFGVVAEEAVGSSRKMAKDDSVPVEVIDARAKEYLDIELEARLQGSPEGIYGRYSGFEPGFKEQRKALRDENERVQSEKTTLNQSESKPERQHNGTRADKPEARQKKFYNKDDHDAMEINLRLESELLADAFASASAGSREIPGDKLVFFVRDGNLIKRVNFADAHGNERPMMNTKLDFHFGKVPVESLKDSVIGWARIAPKVRDGEIVYRQNARGGRPQADTEVVEVGGQVPGSMKRALGENKEVSYGDLMRVPAKVLEEAKSAESSAEALLSKLVKEKRIVEGKLYDHYRNEEGCVLSREELERLTFRYEKIKTLIDKHERSTAVNKSAESTDISAVADEFALRPSEPRAVTIEQGEKLTADITRQLESWKSRPRAKTQPDNKEPNDADKLDALVHVAYNAHSLSKESFAQGKYLEAEAWAMTLYNMVKAADRSERFDSEDKVRVLSWLGEVFRVQNKMNQAESCLKAARLELEKISKAADARALEASILESYAKLLRAETTQARLQEARQLEASRREILDGLFSEGKDANAGVDVWKKALISMRDRRTLKVSMENNAKLLDRSLQILNWFGIKL